MGPRRAGGPGRGPPSRRSIRRRGGPSRTRRRGGRRWWRPAPRSGPGPAAGSGRSTPSGAPGPGRRSSWSTPAAEPLGPGDPVVGPPGRGRGGAAGRGRRRPGPGAGPHRRSPLEAGSVAAKIAWLADHDGGRLDASRWLLTPRDLVAWRLTGEVATDATMASRQRSLRPRRPGGRGAGRRAWPPKLAPVVPSDQVSGRLAGRGGRRPRAGGGHAGGHRRRRPRLRGARHRGRRSPAPWSAGGRRPTSRCRSAERPVRSAAGHGAVEGGRRRVAARGRAVGGRVLAGLARPDDRPPARRAGRAGRRRSARCPGRGGHPLAGRGPGPVVAARRRRRLRRAVLRATGWPIWPGPSSSRWAGRCSGASRPWPPGARRVRPIAGLALGGRGAAVPVWVEVLTGITGLPVGRPPVGPGRLGRCRPAGRVGRSGAGCDLGPTGPGGATGSTPDPAAVGALRRAPRGTRTGWPRP